MIVAPPYDMEYKMFSQLRPQDRWIFNKLTLAERQGILAGPCGTEAPPGEYCLRPIYNIQGMAKGGFYRVTHTGGVLEGKPGYIWTPWSDEPRQWGQFINDQLFFHGRLASVDADGNETYEEGDGSLTLLPSLRGISRYMYVEMLGDQVIDVGPRLEPYAARQEAVEDYQQFDPDYTMPEWAVEARVSEPMLRRGNPVDGYTWHFASDEE